MHIAFGSDGFRGVIGHQLTRDSVARIALAAAVYLREIVPERKDIVVPVGYDTRFMSRDVAGYVARVLAGEGYKPVLAQAPCPSPYLAFAVHHLKQPLGVMVTASHNPYLYGGIKLKGAHGGSLFTRDSELVEQLANMVDPATVEHIKLVDSATSVESFDLTKEYKHAVLEAAGLVGNLSQKLVIDYMHGAAAGIYGDILGEVCDVNTTLRADPDPLFAGAKPEPMPKLLSELALRVAHDGHNTIGLAFDGDGDRLAVVDEEGCFLGPHETFSLLLEHLIKVQGRKGAVVTAVSLSGMGERVAKAHGCEVIESPVGFKYVSQAMVEHEAIIGGEESGGTALGHHLPERDGLLMALTLLAAKQAAGKTIHELVAELYATYGHPVFIRRDIALTSGESAADITNRVRELASLEELAGEKITGLNHRDGMKLKTAQGWVLVRPSGTEPLLRVYGEGESAEQAEAYIGAVLEALGING
jgi:phosphomannomutase